MTTSSFSVDGDTAVFDITTSLSDDDWKCVSEILKRHHPAFSKARCVNPSAARSVSDNFLTDCDVITSIDLKPIRSVTSIGDSFLSLCTGLTLVDLAFNNITSVGNYFLAGCSGLKCLDLKPLTSLTSVGDYFLSGCSGLTSLDLKPLRNVVSVGDSFLDGCSGLTTLNLTPLSNVTSIKNSFLYRCSAIVELDLEPLSSVTTTGNCFLFGCLGRITLPTSEPALSVVTRALSPFQLKQVVDPRSRCWIYLPFDSRDVGLRITACHIAAALAPNPLGFHCHFFSLTPIREAECEPFMVTEGGVFEEGQLRSPFVVPADEHGRDDSVHIVMVQASACVKQLLTFLQSLALNQQLPRKLVIAVAGAMGTIPESLARTAAIVLSSEVTFALLDEAGREFVLKKAPRCDSWVDQSPLSKFVTAVVPTCEGGPSGLNDDTLSRLAENVSAITDANELNTALHFLLQVVERKANALNSSNTSETHPRSQPKLDDSRWAFSLASVELIGEGKLMRKEETSTHDSELRLGILGEISTSMMNARSDEDVISVIETRLDAALDETSTGEHSTDNESSLGTPSENFPPVTNAGAHVPSAHVDRPGFQKAALFGKIPKAEIDARNSRLSKALRHQRSVLGVNSGQPLNIGIAASGGGWRAAMGTAHLINELASAGVLDCVSDIAAVSGSTWTLIQWLSTHMLDEPFNLALDGPDAWLEGTPRSGVAQDLKGLREKFSSASVKAAASDPGRLGLFSNGDAGYLLAFLVGARSVEEAAKSVAFRIINGAFKLLNMKSYFDVPSIAQKYRLLLARQFRFGRKSGDEKVPRIPFSSCRQRVQHGTAPMLAVMAIAEDNVNYNSPRHDWVEMNPFYFTSYANGSCIDKIFNADGTSFGLEDAATVCGSAFYKVLQPKVVTGLGHLKDAGLECNLPVPYFTRPGRAFDIVICVDHSKNATSADELAKAVDLGYLPGYDKTEMRRPFAFNERIRVFAPPPDAAPGMPVIIYVRGLTLAETTRCGVAAAAFDSLGLVMKHVVRRDLIPTLRCVATQVAANRAPNFPAPQSSTIIHQESARRWFAEPASREAVMKELTKGSTVDAHIFLEWCAPGQLIDAPKFVPRFLKGVVRIGAGGFGFVARNVVRGAAKITPKGLAKKIAPDHYQEMFRLAAKHGNTAILYTLLKNAGQWSEEGIARGQEAATTNEAADSIEFLTAVAYDGDCWISLTGMISRWKKSPL